MGFLGKIVKSIGHAVGNIAKGVVKFAKSPLGQVLMNVGLTMLTGGTGGLLAKGLSMLGGLGSGGSLLGTFAGFASKFLGPVSSLVSGSGLSSIAGFLGKMGNTSDLLSMAQSLFSARSQQPQQPDSTTQDILNTNLQQLFAWRQAQQLDAQYSK